MYIKISILSLILFCNIQCQNLNTKKIINREDTLFTNENNMMKRADIIGVASPILVRLEIDKNQNKLIAKLIFENVSEEDVIIDQNRLGGNTLREKVFHLNPWYNHPNLSFCPYDSLKIPPKYIVLKPHQTIETQTDLQQYYNFNEKKYDTLSITYLNRVNYLDKNYQPILKKDIDGIIKPISFSIQSNDIDLNYKKDIKNYIK